MFVPFSWLKEYVDIEAGPEEVAEELLLSGTKVESTKKVEEETIFDLEITPNRADCLGVIGVAREVATLYAQELKTPQPFAETRLDAKRKSVSLEVKEKSLCPYYSIGLIDGLRIQESPEWIQKRLKLVGVRPINNVVDITNYVMMETAQPMHAFDYDKVKGNMILRGAKEGEKVTTLDGVERKLNKGAIIIEDSEKLIDLAGLMGGQNTEVDKDTTTIVLHVPVYDPVAIRKASQFTGLRTEASGRFEKLLDPNGHRFAFERTLHLLKIEASGLLVSDIKSIGYPAKSGPLTVSLEKIKNILGVKISEEETVNILVQLGFEVLPSPSLDESKLEIRPPSWRPDVEIAEDIAEEVGRIWGYNRFPKTLPSGEIPTHEDSFLPDWEKILKKTLQGVGFSEIYTQSMTSADMVQHVGFDPRQILKVNNRMTVDYEYLRPTLLVGLLQSTSLNLRNFDDVSLFELGRVFAKEKDTKTKLPHQPKKIAAVSTSVDFSQIKGVVEGLLEKLNITSFRFEKGNDSGLWSKDSAKLLIGREEAGIIGAINNNVLKNFDIPKSVFGFELDIEILTKFASEETRYKPLPKFPTVKEDLSIVIEKETFVQDILDTIYSLKEKRIHNVQIAEIISWQDKKSILLNLEYYDSKKTLTDSDAEIIRNKIIAALKKNLKAEIR